MTTYKVNIDEVRFSEGGPREEGWIDMQVQFLIDEAHGGAKHIVFGRTLFAPGATHRRHAHPRGEEFEFLTAGRGLALRAEGDIPVAAGDAWFTPMGGMHGFANTGASEVEMIWGWAGAGTRDGVGYQKLEDVAPGSGQTFKISAADTPYAAAGPQSDGGASTTVQWLIDQERGRATQVAFGRSVIAPGAADAWHRHPAAEEFAYLLSGSGVLLSADEEVAARPGDVWLSPRGEWHGFRNTSPEDAVLLWGWAGVGSQAAAGYEVRPSR